MLNLKEFEKLEEFLKENEVSYEKFESNELFFEKHILFVPNREHPSWDAAITTGTYGSSEGLLEICGDIVEKDEDDSYYSEVEGYLTADDVIRKLFWMHMQYNE